MSEQIEVKECKWQDLNATWIKWDGYRWEICNRDDEEAVKAYSEMVVDFHINELKEHIKDQNQKIQELQAKVEEWYGHGK